MPPLDRILAPGLRLLPGLALWGCQGPDVGPSRPPAHLEVVTGGGQIGTAGQALGEAIVARVTDADGRAVPEVLVTFAAAGEGGVLAPGSRRTDERGEAQAVWILGPRAGMLSASIVVDGLAPAPLSATAVSGAPARLAFEAVPGSAIAGVVFDPPVAVAVHDRYGNAVPSSSAEIHLRVNKGTLAGAATAPAVHGTARFLDLRIDQGGTEYRLTATAEGLTPAESGAFPVATAAATQLLPVGGDGQAAAAGSAVAIAPAVVVRDAVGNGVAGVSVTFTVTGGGGTVTPGAVTTAADGRAAPAGWTLGTSVGENTLRVSAAALPGASVEFTAEATPGPAASVEVSPSESGLLQGQTATLTARVLDEQGRPLDGATVAWNSGDTDVASVDAGGIVTAHTPGTATITATSGGRSGSAEVSVSYGEGTRTNITYCTIGEVQEKMDVYVPSASMPRPLPVAVHVHGGGWISGNRSTGTRFLELKETLLERGYLVVSLDYRLAPAYKYPSQIEDVKCAIRHLRSLASRYGLDPDRIGAWGGSAGGQLVGLLGTADGSAGFDEVGGFQGMSSDVQAVIALSAITDFTSPDELRDDYSRAFRTWPDPTSPEMIEASPVTHVTPDDASFFFIVGDEDELVLPEQSVRMDQLLRGAGVSSSLLRVLHADHDLQPTSALPTDPTSAAITSRMADFFDQHLR
jgi:acetyl esterase/lipase